ncbi:MAG: cysteine desulfurase-like protein [Anaerolineae bacterium]|nr:cysteine desulfurase-like protein [Anaerolineae bacterium]MCB9131545.1 cysteine desulfurase-like protein [Anaerolineales bacterium]MCB0228976.1 cysteine desulfurase-like protein [Anaerolineae bacterium]MCB0232904.1 cysteine desulfurase-like protein [Anaerolineae bacterium]MCB0239889.1 cysteine desulfurase-like protein [Anaerolineae bacterium]
MGFTLDTSHIRSLFPSLRQEVDGIPAVFLDNPGGTQVSQGVIDAMSNYLARHNANRGGAFWTARCSDEIIDEAHQAMADLLNAASPDEIVFGPNMTTLTFSVSRAIGRQIGPGDEIIVTRLDHDANITPWVMMAEDRGATVRWVDFDPETYMLDLPGLRNLINERTRVVAVGYASNAVGTINDVKSVCGWARDAGALSFVDAVQYVPHGPVDVQDLGCDMLACSAYKFFGPHMGILYGRYDLLDRLQAYKVRPAKNVPPGKFETGTQSHEGIAGTLASVEYLAEVGRRYGGQYRAGFDQFDGRKLDLRSGMTAIEQHELQLSAAVLDELETIPDIEIHGITDRDCLDQRVPTISFTWPGRHPRAIAEALGNQGIFVWDGNYYALAVTERLGLEDKGGMVRIGAVHYNTLDEIGRLGVALRNLI